MAALAMRVLWPVLGVVAALAVVLGIWERIPVIGPGARIEAQREVAMKWRRSSDAWQEASRKWEAYGLAEKAAFDESERLRSEENDEARVALSEAEQSCTTRLAEARRSAAAIRSIVTEETRRDQNGCPVRGVVDPGRLRDALQPSTGR